MNHEFRLGGTAERHEYLRRAGVTLARSDWRALGFALMSSHVHWAMFAGTQPSSAVIKPLHVGFAGWLNTTQQRLGPVFADRHRSLTFDNETAAALIAYIHNNPVRAGVVSDPSDSTWTSHRAYLGLVATPAWLDVALGLHLCGFPSTPAGRLGFHEMVVARAADARRIDLSGGDMQAVAGINATQSASRPAARHRLRSYPLAADEPTAALDSVRSRSVMELFRKVAHDRGAAVLVVTHDHRALEVFDVLYEMEDGRLRPHQPERPAPSAAP